MYLGLDRAKAPLTEQVGPNDLASGPVPKWACQLTKRNMVRFVPYVKGYGPGAWSVCLDYVLP